MGGTDSVTYPLVSVCLPNLNTLPFLPERINSILAQTYRHWELVVSDNYSEDGAWPFFEALAARDPRVVIEQTPREGMYANWNRCISRARGEFVYIATSDDTMAPDCLEKLVGALSARPDCDLAHCRLRVIDEKGNDRPDWWSIGSIFAGSSGMLLGRRHVRMAPFDGILHLLGGSVYISITQLLLRRCLFDRVGMFESMWGSVGDFNWTMRATLVANTVHVPDTWGGWRIHPIQATAGACVGSAEHAAKIDAMIEHAIRATEDQLPAGVRRCLEPEWVCFGKEFRVFAREVALLSNPFARRAYVLKRVLGGSRPARMHLKASLLRRSFADWVRGWLQQAGVSPVLVPTDVDQAVSMTCCPATHQ
jgi:hypothetical protein